MLRKLQDMEKELLSGSEQKINEYVARIQEGESKDSILKGLPPSFVSGIESGLKAVESAASQENETKVPPQYEGFDSETLDFAWVIPEYVDPEKTKKEKGKKQAAIDQLRKKEALLDNIQKQKQADELKLIEVRSEINTGAYEEQHEIGQAEPEPLKELEPHEDRHLVSGLVKYVSKGRPPIVVDLYRNLLDNIDDFKSRKNLISGLFQDIYNKYRLADYPVDPDEEAIWNRYLKSTDIVVNNKKAEWMYRGLFPKNGEETATRASLNVRVTPDLIESLDKMIIEGKIKANYKFGQPGTPASPTERHDSISIYFVEAPSAEALEELTAITEPYVRGDNLLGRKVSDGFFISEIGSIESGHIAAFVEKLKGKDPAFAEAARLYASPQAGKGDSLKMSEAQFYAVKDVARAFGYKIAYDKDKGFIIDQNSGD